MAHVSSKITVIGVVWRGLAWFGAVWRGLATWATGRDAERETGETRSVGWRMSPRGTSEDAPELLVWAKTEKAGRNGGAGLDFW